MSQKKIPEITFLFNQLLTPDLRTGGEVRGKIISDFFQKDQKFNVKCVIPEISISSFPKNNQIIIGHQSFEKKINHETAFSALVLFISRTIETIKRRSQIKTDILYSTGDFFCDIIPSIFIKKRYPETKLIVVIHHLNPNPFLRRHSSFITSSVSYFFQQLSLILIKKKFDLIFVVNQQVKRYLQQEKKIKQKIIISGNGLDINQINSTLNSLKPVKPKNNICYFGRVSVTKGSLDLPQILEKIKKEFPDIHLDIIGSVSPDIKASLIENFSKCNCQNNYTLHGFINQKKDVFKKMLQSKVILFPSYEEGWGISLFEAVMVKKPVVAYDLPIFKELFEGKLITAPIGNTDIFSQKVIELIKNTGSPKTKKYIDDCYQIAKKYDWNNVFIQEKKYLTEIIKK